jgi:hypothetical protein
VSAPQFTPGPWKCGSAIFAPALGRRVGKVADISIAYKDSKTRDANAALVAASPELYCALEQCVKKLRACASAQSNADFAINALCEPFELALAKARGETA